MSGDTEVFDYLVIGGGSGGLASARRAADHGARVALIEHNLIGGTCVNRGCVPKKILWNAAELATSLAQAVDYGFDVARGPNFDYAKLHDASRAHVKALNDFYTSRLSAAGVEVVSGRARFAGPNLLELPSGRTLSAPHVLIATGARPQMPPIEGAELGITSDDWFQLAELPKRLLVIGGGYVGVELAGIAHVLGTDVTLAYRGALPLPRFDEMLSQGLTETMQQSGLKPLREFTPHRVTRANQGLLTVEAIDGRRVANLDAVLWAIGRVSDAHDWVAAAGVGVDARGFIHVDAYQQTNVPGIYAVGDVTGKASLTPVAIAAGKRLADRLFGGRPEAKLDYDDIPTVVFSHPPIGTVGLSEAQARERHGDRVKCYVTRFTNLYHQVTHHKQTTAMKLVTLLPDERVIGIHVIGRGADEMIQGFAVALRMGAHKADLERTVAVHPTAAEEFVTMA